MSDQEEPISAVVLRAQEAVEQIRPRLDRCPPSWGQTYEAVERVLGDLEIIRRRLLFAEASPWGTGELEAATP